MVTHWRWFVRNETCLQWGHRSSCLSNWLWTSYFERCAINNIPQDIKIEYKSIKGQCSAHVPLKFHYLSLYSEKTLMCLAHLSKSVNILTPCKLSSFFGGQFCVPMDKLKATIKFEIAINRFSKISSSTRAAFTTVPEVLDRPVRSPSWSSVQLSSDKLHSSYTITIPL
jgi:hypothetical protein